MALPELQRRLAHLYDSQEAPDVFGRRAASPNEISQALQPNRNLFDQAAVGNQSTNIDWRELKRLREQRRIAARTLKNHRR